MAWAENGAWTIYGSIFVLFLLFIFNIEGIKLCLFICNFFHENATVYYSAVIKVVMNCSLPCSLGTVGVS